MIHFDVIENANFDTLINKFDEDIDYLKNNPNLNIELKTYGNILRNALNNVQPESFDNLITSLKLNRELENSLDNAGGYSIDYISEHNAKNSLLSILNYLKADPIKLNALIDCVNLDKERKTIVADASDVDYLNHVFRLKRLTIISFPQFKKSIRSYKNLIFYSFNGKKDFDFISQIQQDATFVIHALEKNLYDDQVIKQKCFAEQEICGNDRKIICGISYEPIPDLPIQISTTIDGIINRLDKLGDRDYDNYKEECDSLLDEIEKNIYKISFDNNTYIDLDSTDTVFDDHGDLIKVYRSSLSIGSCIRIYPKEHFADYLYQVAVETDNDIFKTVEENYKLWLSVLKELEEIHKDGLYEKLKAKGLKVLPATVDAYFNGQIKFPMYNNDLKALFSLKYQSISSSEIDAMLAPIRKSKSIYNSTMIALGRGLRQEIRLYLKEKRLGEILAKLKFDITTLQVFINDYMPLLTIKKKEAYNNETKKPEIFKLSH